MELGTLSPFERAFVKAHNPGLCYAALHSVRVVNETEELLTLLANKLSRDDRVPIMRFRLIDIFVRTMIAPARALGGTALISSIIRGVEDFDQRFLQAASLIAQ